MRATPIRRQIPVEQRFTLKNWGLVALAIVTILLIVVGILSFGAFFMMRDQL
jgi:hypothetical protein